MPLERLTFDNGKFKAAMENFKNTKVKEREAFDRAMTDSNNELNDLQVGIRFFCFSNPEPGLLTLILVYLG